PPRALTTRRSSDLLRLPVHQPRQRIDGYPAAPIAQAAVVHAEVQMWRGGSGVACVADEADDRVDIDGLTLCQTFWQRVEVRVEVADAAIADDRHRDGVGIDTGNEARCSSSDGCAAWRHDVHALV